MSKSTYLIDLQPVTFTNLTPGEAIRLFPFGELHKDGTVHHITPEYAKQFKLPPWKPAIKLGSHEDKTPAGAYINGLDVREDGLYAIIDVTDKGAKALKEGDYRYHSPEVIWDDGYLEDSEGGEDIQGPLILGGAFLHNPHLGERAALFHVEPLEEQMTTDKLELTVPEAIYERFSAIFNRDEKPDEDNITPDEFAAAIKERDEYKVQIETLETEREEQEQFEAIKAEFDTEEFGIAFAEIGNGEITLDMIRRIRDLDVRAWVLQQFKALSSQIKESGLTDELGHDLEVDADPTAAFNAAIKAIEVDKGISYNAAMDIAKIDHADLFKAYLENK